MPPATRRSPAALLALLVLVSGFCGISYEILYTRILGNLLGNQFTINASVLLTFLLGIGLGTLVAHRFARFLWAIELAIGLYALLMVASAPAVEDVLFQLLPALGTSLAACAAVSIVLLLLPACLIGCSVPLFAACFAAVRSDRVFSLTYAIYNVGAALTALAMEFVLLRAIGLRAATASLAALNVAVAATLWWLSRRAPLFAAPPPQRIRFPRRLVAGLAVASTASAIFQLLMIKLGEFVLGPFNETFALVLASVLLGISVGSLAAGRLHLGFQGSLLVALAGLALLVSGFGTTTAAFAALFPVASTSYPLLVLLKLALILALMALPALGFGATIPALLHTHQQVARESGELLFWSSIANAAGFLLMAFVLHRHLSYGALILLTAALTLIAVLLHPPRHLRRLAAAAALFGAALLGHRVGWDESLLYVGYMNFHSSEALRSVRSARLVSQPFRGAQDVFAIVTRGGEPHFFINGYFSVPLTSASEKIVGALSSMFSPRTDRALVLGVGSGATAGTVGLIFERTDAVEINPVVLENLHRMAPYNFDIEHQPGTRIIHDDGIRVVRSASERYSLILNTVTTPLYFSSSKLYTSDFFSLVTRRLTPDGVYVTWIDTQIGDRGVDIVLETLSRHFAGCWASYLTAGYFMLACSNAPLELHQFAAVSAQPTLRRFLVERHDLPPELLPYAIVSLEALALRSPGAPLNTLDHPALEFEMARLGDQARIEGFARRAFEGIDPDALRLALRGTLRWTPEGANRYFELRKRDVSRIVESLGGGRS